MTTITPLELIQQKIPQMGELYHRLILVVGPSGSGKTSILKETGKSSGSEILNLNLELSRRMLELSERKRALRAPRLLAEIVEQVDGEVIGLDNTEMLFDASLKLDPLRLLQGLSRDRTVVAAWNGTIADSQLTYAVPEHPEYRRYQTRDLIIVELKKNNNREAERTMPWNTVI